MLSKHNNTNALFLSLFCFSLVPSTINLIQRDKAETMLSIAKINTSQTFSQTPTTTTTLTLAITTHPLVMFRWGAKEAGILCFNFPLPSSWIILQVSIKEWVEKDLSVCVCVCVFRCLSTCASSLFRNDYYCARILSINDMFRYVSYTT